jgi:hypothetical protein
VQVEQRYCKGCGDRFIVTEPLQLYCEEACSKQPSQAIGAVFPLLPSSTVGAMSESWLRQT